MLVVVVALSLLFLLLQDNTLDDPKDVNSASTPSTTPAVSPDCTVDLRQAKEVFKEVCFRKHNVLYTGFHL